MGSKLGFKYNVDTSDKQIYNSMADLQAILEETWISDLPQIIMAENNEAALKKYESTLRKAKNKGYETWLQFQNLSFQANKNAMGIKFAYPMNDPNYKAPEVRLFGFYDEYKKPVPSYIAINE